MSTYYLFGAVLVTKNTLVNKTDKKYVSDLCFFKYRNMKNDLRTKGK